MNPVAWLDDIGKPAWIGLMIVSFVLFWPLGLVVLGFMIGSGRMGCSHSRHGGQWRSGIERMQQRAAQWCGPRGWGQSSAPRSSGNRAFDEYREETLRRLEEEERQFKEFLDLLRQAKDKAEFDQFMAEMRRRPDSAGPAPEPEV
jgi:hypothetical protein